MSVLMRATEIEGRPVVTLAGDDGADMSARLGAPAPARWTADAIVRQHDGGRVPVTVVGGPLRGPDGEVALEEEALAAGGLPDNRNVLGNQVLTDTGIDLGKVVDVIIETGVTAEIVGYEVAASEALATHGEHVLIPLPDTIAVSGEHLMVPAAALEFVSHDLSGFGAAVQDFRAKLRQGSG